MHGSKDWCDGECEKISTFGVYLNKAKKQNGTERVNVKKSEKCGADQCPEWECSGGLAREGHGPSIYAQGSFTIVVFAAKALPKGFL
jgi:hypothetical protein